MSRFAHEIIIMAAITGAMAIGTWAAISAASASNAAEAQHIAQKRAAQKKRDEEQRHASKLDRVAQMVCEESHGPDAVHWWDDSGVLVCAATRGAMDAATEAVRIAKGATR